MFQLNLYKKVLILKSVFILELGLPTREAKLGVHIFNNDLV